MKVLTILGVRPELIRLSRIIQRLNNICDHRVLFTNQNYSYDLSKVFIDEFYSDTSNWTIIKAQSKNFHEQIGNMFKGVDSVLETFKPDKVVILGDTNSSLCAIYVERMGIPVYHMEAGNRCYDKRVPEEVNRSVIDHVSSYNLTYTKNSYEILLAEGIKRDRLFITGNPIFEVYKNVALDYTIYRKYSDGYFLATVHRHETVTNKIALTNIVKFLNRVCANNYPLVFSCHPKTQDYMKKFNLKLNKNVMFYKPIGFKQFGALLTGAKMVFTDSGTVQEEACIFRIPCVVLRNSTERMETVQCGASIIAGNNNCGDMLNAYHLMLGRSQAQWIIPPEYLIPNVSEIACNYILGKQL